MSYPYIIMYTVDYWYYNYYFQLLRQETGGGVDTAGMVWPQSIKNEAKAFLVLYMYYAHKIP